MLYPGTGKPLFEQLKDVLIQKILEGDIKRAANFLANGLTLISIRSAGSPLSKRKFKRRADY